jgi:hypothetical protein
MKKPKSDCNCFFVDEAGDPTLYDRHVNIKTHSSVARPVYQMHGMKPTFAHRGVV